MIWFIAVGTVATKGFKLLPQFFFQDKEKTKDEILHFAQANKEDLCQKAIT